MSAELIGVLAVGAALAGVMLAGLRGVYVNLRDLRAEIERVRTELRAEIERVRTDLHAEIERVHAEIEGVRTDLRAEIEGVRTDLRAEIAALRDDMREHRREVGERFERVENRLAAVEHGQAKLEGLLEGLREAITRRAA